MALFKEFLLSSCYSLLEWFNLFEFWVRIFINWREDCTSTHGHLTILRALKQTVVDLNFSQRKRIVFSGYNAHLIQIIIGVKSFTNYLTGIFRRDVFVNAPLKIVEVYYYLFIGAQFDNFSIFSKLITDLPEFFFVLHYFGSYLFESLLYNLLIDMNRRGLSY